MKQIILIFVASLFLGGCASSQKVNQYISTPHEEQKLNVEFIPQGDNLCGPAVLKMASQKYLPDVPFETYKELAFREKADGTLKSDMISAARRLGLAPYRVSTLQIMFQEVDQGRPVVIFQNLGLSWYTKWHYALLVGYNSSKNIVYLHSGFTPNLEMGFGLFTRTWRRGDYWSYVIVPANTIPAYATFDEALDNATVFENIKNLDSAKVVYQSMTIKWPERFEPHLGLANFYYENKKPNLAIQETLTALKKNPSHPALFYNLAVLYHETKQPKKAQHMKKKTLAAAPKEEKDVYLNKFTF